MKNKNSKIVFGIMIGWVIFSFVVLISINRLEKNEPIYDHLKEINGLHEELLEDNSLFDTIDYSTYKYITKVDYLKVTGESFVFISGPESGRKIMKHYNIDIQTYFNGSDLNENEQFIIKPYDRGNIDYVRYISTHYPNVYDNEIDINIAIVILITIFLILSLWLLYFLYKEQSKARKEVRSTKTLKKVKNLILGFSLFWILLSSILVHWMFDKILDDRGYVREVEEIHEYLTSDFDQLKNMDDFSKYRYIQKVDFINIFGNKLNETRYQSSMDNSNMLINISPGGGLAGVTVDTLKLDRFFNGSDLSEEYNFYIKPLIRNNRFAGYLRYAYLNDSSKPVDNIIDRIIIAFSIILILIVSLLIFFKRSLSSDYHEKMKVKHLFIGVVLGWFMVTSIAFVMITNVGDNQVQKDELLQNEKTLLLKGLELNEGLNKIDYFKRINYNNLQYIKEVEYMTVLGNLNIENITNQSVSLHTNEIVNFNFDSIEEFINGKDLSNKYRYHIHHDSFNGYFRFISLNKTYFEVMEIILIVIFTLFISYFLLLYPLLHLRDKMLYYFLGVKDIPYDVANSYISEDNSDEVISRTSQYDIEGSVFPLEDLVEDIYNINHKELELYKTELVITSYFNNKLYGDYRKLIDIFKQLIQNALQYGDRNNITISFEQKENNQLIRVTNTGKPLIDEEISQVFDINWRGENTAEQQGKGLGLYIAKQILKKMEGDIYAERSEEGMSFIVMLKKHMSKE